MGYDEKTYLSNAPLRLEIWFTALQTVWELREGVVGDVRARSQFVVGMSSYIYY